MMKKFNMEKPMVPKTREMVCKHKPVSPEFWAFLEEIDAPQWVDLALEGTSNCREWDDSWFHTVHSFHQKSFHDLVSASPLAVQTKGKVSKPVRFNPGIANSVSKSRGKKQWSRNKVAGIPIDLSAVNKPLYRQTRLPEGKISSSKPIDNVNTGRSVCLHKSSDTASTAWSQIPSTGNELKNPRCERVNLSTVGDINNQSTEACSQMLSKEHELKNAIDEQVKSSTVGISNRSAEACSQIHGKGNELKNQINEQVKSSTVVGTINQSAEACSQIPIRGNELKNPIDVQVKSSGVDDLNNQSTVVEVRAPMSRTTGLLSMLKMASLRRSCGMLPMRVEVKDIQQPKDRKSSNNISSGSMGGSNRKTSSLGSIGNNSQQVKKENKIKLLKNQVRSSTISPIDHNRKKSSIGSSSTIVEKSKKGCEAAITKTKPRGTSKEVGRKQGQPIGEVSQELGKSQGQLVGGRNCDGVLSMRTKTASRRPLQDVHNVGPSQRKVGMLRNQRFAGKENNNLGTIQNQKINRVEGKKPLTAISGTFDDHEELKVPARPKAESTIHSIKDIKQWEKNSGRSYFSLGQMQREKANREIQISKYRYR